MSALLSSEQDTLRHFDYYADKHARFAAADHDVANETNITDASYFMLMSLLRHAFRCRFSRFDAAALSFFYC